MGCGASTDCNTSANGGTPARDGVSTRNRYRVAAVSPDTADLERASASPAIPLDGSLGQPDAASTAVDDDLCADLASPRSASEDDSSPSAEHLERVKSSARLPSLSLSSSSRASSNRQHPLGKSHPGSIESASPKLLAFHLAAAASIATGGAPQKQQQQQRSQPQSLTQAALARHDQQRGAVP